jgi:large subunit ribosomal protein L25
MADSIAIEATKREELGSTKVGRLRRAGWLPCIVNSSEGRSDPIQINMHDFQMLLRHHSRDNLIADLSVDGGKAVKAILKDIQYDPVSSRLVHVDFAEISMTKKMHVSIPLELTGDPVGVLEQDGMLTQSLRELEVECLPGDILDTIAVDVSGLNVGDSLHVSDLDVPDSMTVLSEADTSVVSVVAQIAEEEEGEEGEEEAAEGDAATPEVIGDKKDDDDEGETSE